MRSGSMGIVALLLFASTAAGARVASTPGLGTWTGTSTCVGNRPACKNEVVVYRVLPIEGDSVKVRLYGDKIVQGKRVPMGTLDFVVAGPRLTCDFRWAMTHGIWEFTVAGDSMTGTLVLLPDRELGRRVSVHRVADKTLPPAPALEEYFQPADAPLPSKRR